jgi:hypothetical protein
MLGALSRYDAWFAQHASDLLGVGFTDVHGYRSSTGPRTLANVYEIPDLEVFGDDYARSRDRDELGRSVRPLLSPAELAVFRAEHTVGDPAVLASPGLSVWEFTPAAVDDAVDDAVERWYADSELASLAKEHGILTARLCRAVPAPVAPVGEARFRVLLSAATPEDAFVASDSLLSRYVSRWRAEPAFSELDVLTHRVSYPQQGPGSAG